MNDTSRPIRALIDLSNLRSNISFLKSLIPEGCRFMAVVKANAYGHGDIQVSKASLEAGADCLGVAIMAEARRLREAGFDCPIHLLFEPSLESAPEAVALDLTCSVYTSDFARFLSEAASESEKKVKVHVKIDTGMHRVGIDPEDLESFFKRVSGLQGLEIEGIYTHFACADDPTSGFTEKQMEIFEQAAARAEEILGRTLIKHAANSAGILAHRRSHYDMVRAGIAIYGLSPSSLIDTKGSLKPVLSVEGEVVFSKLIRKGEGVSYGLKYIAPSDTNVAVIPVGYGDGFSRILSDKAHVLLGGKRRRVIGNICMDLSMVETGSDRIQEGTKFILVGRQGEDEITVDELASLLGTINYEVLCMLDGRIQRVYQESAEGGER